MLLVLLGLIGLFLPFVNTQADRDVLPWGHGKYAPDVISNLTYTDTVLHTNITRRANDFYLRIMPLGASITQGYASADNNGYRKWLRQQLRSKGYKVNMVGSKQDGTMNDNDNEGHPGWTISQVETAAHSVVQSGVHPNLILINVGTNDCLQNRDVANAGSRLKSMVDWLFNALPETTIIVSTLVPHKTVDSCMVNVNSQYRSVVQSYSNKRIALADMHSALTTDDILSDNTHPNAGGYKKMAAVWWNSFQQIQHLIQPPDNSVDDSKVEPKGACPKVSGNAAGSVMTQRGSGHDDGQYVHSSVSRGAIVTVNDVGVENFHFGQLVNLNNIDRGLETDELIVTEKQKDGSFKYAYKLNSGGSYGPWINFTSPVTCSGDVRHIFKDVNNDGLDDIWCIGSGAQVSVAVNKGGNPPKFVSIGQIIGAQSGYTAKDVVVGDIDGDGRDDYCLLGNGGSLRCWRNSGWDDKPQGWQGFTSAGTPGDAVFPSQNIANRYAVRLGDLNGDFRADWLSVNDVGRVTTWMNQRGWNTGVVPSSSKGIVPNWISRGATHGGMNTAGAGENIKFGRVYGSGRLDYTWFKKDGKGKLAVNVWQNTGSGGKLLKGDGVFYCDMTGSGSDDYIWVYNDGHGAEFYGNIHGPPYWNNGKTSMFSINRPRRSLHIADWDGDGKCDLLAQRKSDGALEMWRNDYDEDTGKFTFSYQGFIAGTAKCNQGWGVGLFDAGLILADLDGDGRTDYLCVEKDGRVTGLLNKATGLIDAGQIKFSEGWDRANIRFADVEAHGKADLLHVDKYTGATTVMTNGGNVPKSGSSFSWLARGVLYAPIDRGANMHFANLGGQGRADLIQVLPITNRAWTNFNECPGGGGGDDGSLTDPGLPGVSEPSDPEDEKGDEKESSSEGKVCISGEDDTVNTGDLCAFSCRYDFCPESLCTCTKIGPPVKLPSEDKNSNMTAYDVVDVDLQRLCNFACKYGYCPDDTCTTPASLLNDDTDGIVTVEEDPNFFNYTEAREENSHRCAIHKDTSKTDREQCKARCQAEVDAGKANNDMTTNYGCVGFFPLDQDIPWTSAPCGNDYIAPGTCNCNNWLVNQLAKEILDAMPVIAQVGCYIVMSSIKFVLDIGLEFVPGVGEVLDAGLDMAITAAQMASYIYPEGENPEDAFSWWLSPCGGTDLVPDDIKKVFDTLNMVPGGVSSFKSPKNIRKGSGRKGDGGNPRAPTKPRPNTGGSGGRGGGSRKKCSIPPNRATKRVGKAKNTLRLFTCDINGKTATNELVVTSLTFAPNARPTHVQKHCDITNSQACFHYSSANRVNPQWETLTCKPEAASTKYRLNAQATNTWKTEHEGTDWLSDILKENCQKDEWPPAYFLNRDDPAWKYAGTGREGQRMRYLPALENGGAGRLWASLCFKTPLEALSDKELHDKIKSGYMGIPKNPKAQLEVTEAEITVDVLPEMSLTYGHAANPPKDDGLWDNPCWPKDKAATDPGFALLSIDEWYDGKKDLPKWNYKMPYVKGINGD